jgi:CHAD domain-containing protein/transcriptional regulator with XRE-family HTH domain
MLQPDQREQLKGLLSKDISASERRRVQLLLLYDRGMTTSAIAKEVGLSPSRVRYWRRAFLAQGMEIFQSLSDVAEAADAPIDSAQQAEYRAVEERPTQQTTAPEWKPLSSTETTLDDAVEDEKKDVLSQEEIGPTPDLAPQEEMPEVDVPPKPMTIEAFRQVHEKDHRHAEYIRDLATHLFDILQPFHNLPDAHRKFLETSALLHNIALDTQDRVDPRRGRDLIQNTPLVDFSPQEQVVLANLVQYQRGKIKGKDREQLDFSSLKQGEAMVLLSLLRVAIGLDSSHTQTTQIEQLIESPFSLYLVIEGEHEIEDAIAAQQGCKLWNKLFHPNLRVITSQKAGEISFTTGAIPFPEPMKSPGVEPDDTLAEAGRKTLRYHFAEMLRHQEGTILGEDIEELHDMRVAVRRMRVTFEIFQDAFDPKATQRHRKNLRATGRALGRVRDLDVFIEKAKHYLETLPEEQREGLSPLFHAWEDQRQTARQRMLKFLEGERYRSFLEAFNIFVNTPGAGVKQGDQDYHVPSIVRHVAPTMIYNRLGAVRAYEQILDAARIEQLHELRIEFKRLRYTMEFFREVLGPEAKVIIEQIKVVQDHLGDLNDADVACQILTDFLERWEARQQTLPLNERESPEPIVTYLAFRHAERHHLMVTFGETWESFNREALRGHLAAAVAVL